MRRVVTIDIETLPADPDTFDSSLEKTKGNDEEVYLKTALNGDFGRILCIGYADDNPLGLMRKGVIGWDAKAGRFHGDERKILDAFWRMLDGFRPNVDRIVGHNVFDFDLRFILKRSVLHGIKPPVELSFARYRNQPVFDTMYEWERWNPSSRITLDRLARVLGLTSSKTNGIDGSTIYAVFMQGSHQAIHDYCAADVELTRAIYRKLVFADSVPEEENRSHQALPLPACV